jgi:3-(methylthio)propanoyl-CoA dehydrogenase
VRTTGARRAGTGLWFTGLCRANLGYGRVCPPLRDIRFVLEQVVDLSGLSKLEAYHHADPDTVLGLIEESGRFVADVVGPLNRVGDVVGSSLDGDGMVTTPPGFAEAYRQYVEAGWGSVSFPRSSAAAGSRGWSRS